MLPVVGGDVHYILRIWLLKKTTDEPAKMADQAVLASCWPKFGFGFLGLGGHR